MPFIYAFSVENKSGDGMPKHPIGLALPYSF